VFEELPGFLAAMNDEVIEHYNNFLSALVRGLGDGLPELLHERTEARTILVIFPAMNGLSGHKIDGSKTIAFQVLTRRPHFARRAWQGPGAQKTWQEIKINCILKEHQNFTVPGRFLVLFQWFDLAAIGRIRAGEAQHRS
jgi:hypothetical protein